MRFNQKTTLSTILLFFFCMILPHAAEAGSPFPGRERVLEVPLIESTEESGVPVPVIDGRLNEAAWEKAAVSNTFWCSLKNKKPSDDTEVLVMRDSEYLYVGFRIYDKNPEAIQSTTAVRNVGMGYDDAITVQLDPFFNHRDISNFSVNPGGAQSDTRAGGRSSKIEWRGDWEGAAERTDYGWSAEFAIPFAILNYQDGDTVFGVNFMRYQSRTKEFSYWADITPQGLNEEMGRLTGLVLPPSSEKKAWTFMPYALAGRNIPDKKRRVKDFLGTGGIDVRYQPRRNLTGMLALNPDFSQVEDAVSDISFSYSEKALSENRPFFAEGSGYFTSGSDDTRYFYSRRIPDFNVGTKAFGRVGRTKLGILLSESPDDRYDVTSRVLYELDKTNSAIGTVVGTQQPEFNNILTAAQFGGRQDYGLNYSVDAAVTETTEVTDPDIPDGSGAHYKGSLGWKWDYMYVTATGDKYDTSYYPANALLANNVPGTRGASLVTGYSREMSHPVWQAIEGSVGTKYRETSDGRKQSQTTYGSGSVEFQNDMRVGLYHDQGPYRPVSDTRGVFKNYFNQDTYNSATVDFNTRSNQYSGGVQYDWGKLGGDDYEYYAAYTWWRPVTMVRLNVTAERTNNFGTSDQIITTASWNITPEQALAGRVIYTDDAQYYRLAYSFKPRKGLDIYAVYDDNPTSNAEYSVKVVKTF
ncbi:MAG: carbohydrate binding family 9 domain-containing protein [Candidatus Omnitrophica bacterium]|nr:carbohydrate binding family 9 domain-containing protein [Candidatus Omnitrophota bacterium]